MNHICFVVKGYPTNDDPIYTFIQTLVHAIADGGIKCTVIAPQTINGKSRTGKLRKTRWFDVTPNGNKITILQPLYSSFGKLKIINIHLTTFFRDKAITKAANSIKDDVDIYYGHFWDCALSVAPFCEKNNKRLIVATGESSINLEKYYSREYIEKYKTAISGVISVSSKNVDESHKLGLLENASVVVLPNAVDERMFFKIDRAKTRQELGFGADDFIVSFIGSFNERKGVNRLIEAAKQVDGVKLILIGSGIPLNQSNQIVFSGKVPHGDIAKYLNASDIFCLPTLHEGCCNAIVEAMSCGLPVVSSDRDFNKDILDPTMSICIDPTNIKEIAGAIEQLMKSKQLCESMSLSALKKAKSYTISSRARKIVSFIKNISER